MAVTVLSKSADLDWNDSLLKGCQYCNLEFCITSQQVLLMAIMCSKSADLTSYDSLLKGCQHCNLEFCITSQVLLVVITGLWACIRSGLTLQMVISQHCTTVSGICLTSQKCKDRLNRPRQFGRSVGTSFSFSAQQKKMVDHNLMN